MKIYHSITNQLLKGLQYYLPAPLQTLFFSFLLLIFINCFFGFNVTKPIISGIEIDSPAYKSGLKEGDEILEVNEKISDFESLREVINNSESKTLNIVFSRNNKIQSLKIDSVNKKIGIRGTVESRKLGFVESIFKSSYQIYFFYKSYTCWNL